MTRKQTRLIAFGLAIAFALPAPAEAGLFGWFKRKRTTCRPAPTCPAPTSASHIPVERQTLQTSATYCHVLLFGQRWDEQNSQWVQCHAAGQSDLGDAGLNCQGMVDQARDRAHMALPSGCAVDMVYAYCEDGSCEFYTPEYPPPTEGIPTAGAPISDSCVYKVTYQICCCGGMLIDEHVCHPDLEIAKYRAKVVACHRASTSGCKIRWCRWKICRVPASQCKR